MERERQAGASGCSSHKGNTCLGHITLDDSPGLPYSRGRFAVALVAMALSGTAPLRGQRASISDVPITTDRPSIANSSVVVPKGVFQVENGLLVTDTQGQYTLDLP